MQKWEYLEVIYNNYSGGAKFVPYTINGQEVKDFKNQPDRATHLSQLGQQGWELVAFDWNGGGRAIFKRPVK
jgi:hypothetical protein